MTNTNVPCWEDRLRSADDAELRRMLELRLGVPPREGPPLDDRSSEGVEEAFVRLSAEDPSFQARLEQVIRAFILDEVAAPNPEASRPILRGIFEICLRRPLPGAFTALQAWLFRHQTVLRQEPAAALARAALGALAISQLPGIAASRDFWLQLWKTAPDTWKPRVFIGLRLQDPAAACDQIPSLLEHAERQRPPGDPGALLRGLWGQTTGRLALMAWLREFGDSHAAGVVRRAVPEIPESFGGQGRRVRPPLPSLACGGRLWEVATI